MAMQMTRRLPGSLGSQAKPRVSKAQPFARIWRSRLIAEPLTTSSTPSSVLSMGPVGDCWNPFSRKFWSHLGEFFDNLRINEFQNWMCF